jgi:hypothetical protein
VLKQVLEKLVWSDYMKGLGIRHYLHKPPPIPLDETNEKIKELSCELSKVENERDYFKERFTKIRYETKIAAGKSKI